MSVFDRTLRAVVAVVALRAAAVGCAADPDGFVADVAGLCEIIADEYAYLDEKLVDWSRVAEAYRGDVEAAGADPARQLTVIEAMLEELYDFHVTLNLVNERSPVVVPRDTDVWAEMIGGHAVITAVRPGSPAAVTGLKLGDRVVSIDGAPLLDVLNARIGRCGARGDPAAFDWALVAALAGQGQRHIGVDAQRQHARLAGEAVAQAPPSRTGRLNIQPQAGAIGQLVAAQRAFLNT
jgi:hypothetical protein